MHWENDHLQNVRLMMMLLAAKYWSRLHFQLGK